MEKFRYRLTIWKGLLPFFDRVKWSYVGDIVSELLIRVLDMLFPVVYGILLEKIIIQKQKNLLGWVLGAYLALQIVKSLCKVLQTHCQNKVNHKVYRKLRVAIMEKYFGRKFPAYQSLTTGDIKMTVEDAVNKLNGFQTQFSGYCLNCFFGILMVTVLFEIDWRMALVSFVSIPLTFLMDHAVSKAEKDHIERMNQNYASWASWLDETIKSWREIRINRCEAKRETEFTVFQTNEDIYHGRWIRFWVTRVLVIPQIKDEFIMQFVLYFLGGILIYYNQLTIGVLLVFVKYFGILSDSVKAVSESDANLQSEQVHYERILRHLREETIMETDGTELPEAFTIHFNEVSFSYGEKEKKILDRKSFFIKKGEKVGICGASGTGKSTLVKLLLGQLEPTEGSVLYDGIPFSEICKEEFYKKIAYISQDAKLFQESVAENLRLGKTEASEDEMKEACEKAKILDVISQLPEGLETDIGENGSMLSGGQRQRILLAKAFLRDAQLYVFDEATGALDGQVGAEIEEAIESLPQDKTVILVSHKKSLLNRCDRVISVL
ncbi:MAG: ABC transporter ATP-binding protein [Lachnospiraceae bacterium]|nr:ABC transporter ATP-binding protein [Lachnospiraceae bacterium]